MKKLLSILMLLVVPSMFTLTGTSFATSGPELEKQKEAKIVDAQLKELRDKRNDPDDTTPLETLDRMIKQKEDQKARLEA